MLFEEVYNIVVDVDVCVHGHGVVDVGPAGQLHQVVKHHVRQLRH